MRMTCRTPGLLDFRGRVDVAPYGLQRFVSGLRRIKAGTKRCSPHRNFMKTMCTYMDRCRCAVVISLWHKSFRLWGKLCAMRWGKMIGCGVSYHPCSHHIRSFLGL